MKLGIIGLGKLGLPLALVFAKVEFKVSGVDIDQHRISQIKTHGSFFEPKLNEYLENYGANLNVSTSYSLLKNCEVTIIITQTPSLPSGKFDIAHAETALKQLHEVNPDCLAVISSTINSGSIDKLSKIHERICYNPEFIAQGNIIHDFENPKFVVIGAYNEKDALHLVNVWRKVHDKPIYIVKPIEAEIIKLAGNLSFALGITFANTIGELCRKFNANSNNVLDIIYQDRRNYKPGLGFGGFCFRRDVNCFKAMAIENAVGSAHQLANLLANLNHYTLERYLRKIKSFGKKKIAMLGIAYKPHVPYTHDSQPLEIARKLALEGYEIHIYDPLAEDNAKQALPQAFFHPTVKESVDNSEVVFIGTSNYAEVKTDRPTVNPWR